VLPLPPLFSVLPQQISTEIYLSEYNNQHTSTAMANSLLQSNSEGLKTIYACTVGTQDIGEIITLKGLKRFKELEK
jgi:hypothetical protein